MNPKVFKRLLSILLVIFFVITTSTGWAANLKVHIINVGQGDCELIVSPTGKTVLIDAGKNGKGDSVVLPYLSNRGISQLDYIVASHYHADHIGGIDEVVNGLGGISYITTAVYDRGGAYSSQTYTDYANAVTGKRTTITPGQVINLGGGAQLTCIAVDGRTKNGTVYTGTDENYLSVVLKLDYLDFQVYLGGDSGQAIESAAASLAGNIDVYKVSHHGSDTSSSQGFLDVVQPEISTIPVGTNTYGHPSSTVHTRLMNVGSYIYQTETGNQAPPTGYGEVANGSFNIVTDGCSYTVSGSALSTATYATDGSYDCGGGETHIVFSEVLYDSEVYYETEGEWIELYNPTGTTVNLGGWTIEDNSNTYTIPNGTSIGSGDYLVIADGSTHFIQKYGCGPHLSDLSLRLNNDGDFLTLKNNSGTVIDQVAWESGGSSVSGWGSTSLPYANEGKSIARSDVNQDTDTYTDWMSNRNPGPNIDGIPEIALDTTNLSFELLPGDYSDTQTFSVSNTGCGTLDWSVSDNAAWLSCSPGSGTESGNVKVTVKSSGLAVGTYTGTVTVTDPNASNSPRSVTVTLTVTQNPSPRITLTPGTLSFEACPGTTDNQTFSVSNSGYGTLNWWVSDDAAWLNCTPSSGSDSGTVTVSVNTTGLTSGVYTGTVTVTDANASNSPQTVTVTVTVLECDPPEIALSRTQFNYGASGAVVTSPQTFLISNSGSGALNWTVSSSTNWLTCTPSTGTNSGVVTVSINANRYGLPVGNYTGYITVSDPNAANSPRTVTIKLNIYSSDAPPFGTFETPTHNSAVCSSIPVTGWVLDDIEVESVKIYRKTGNSLTYIGDAILVAGARPDVEQAYPGYPKNYQAGWGYMMLTNFLPDQGNGVFIITVTARDTTGHEITLGTQTINCDNLNAVKPFGAIDTPTPGGSVSDNNYINWGWALTPQPNCIPIDGSTINVYVDGVNLGHPTYSIYRSDIASMFPNYCNSNGSAGYFCLDTTAYENGVHTIQWVVTDNAGNTDGIGSRYFSIQNIDGATSQKRSAVCNVNRQSCDIEPAELSRSDEDNFQPVEILKGYKEGRIPELIYPGDEGVITIEIKELERVEIHLQGKREWQPLPKRTDYRGYMKVNDRLTSLPVGSTLDSQRGIFYWQPGVGFLGEYPLVFMENHFGQWVKKNIIVRIVPGSLPEN